MLSDGDANYLTDPTGSDSHVEAHIPYRQLFDFVWHGSRHVMMGASQLDKFGNQNISAIGADFARPKAQLIGVRGAPGNTINHPTSYWIANHSPKVFVEKVDVVSGVGYDRARAVGHAARFHEAAPRGDQPGGLRLPDAGPPDARSARSIPASRSTRWSTRPASS